MQIEPTPFAREMGRRVYEARKAQGLTQMELGLAAGVSTRALHSIEHGTLSPRLETMQRILSVLGMTLEVTARPARRMSTDRGMGESERRRRATGR
jgi:transcriptional regulator with XRE-family HTH domain